MNFLGVGPAELLVILIIALLVFGPSKLPQVAKDLGGAIGKWRQALDEIQSVADAPLKEVRELKQALDPATMEKKLQESVQQIVSLEPPSPGKDDGQEPPSPGKDDDQAPAVQVEEKQSEAEDECRT
ncbi:MAG: twin-arginine translocase TatA/TatE family subunit [Anaerolineae bacterium]|nr:twin-arginine translocase TatA/TatE family subunit [Anaerolineae bacterium]